MSVRCSRPVIGPALASLIAMMCLAMGLLLSGPMTTGASAAINTSETWNFAANGTMQLKGHGYGHGHGMSQYGAQGAALRGLNERQILAFYYPGTAVARAAVNIAVLISADTSNDLKVLWRSGLTVRDRGTGARYRLPAVPRVDRWRMISVRTHTYVQFRRDKVWRNYRVGGRAHLVGDGEFSAPGRRLSLVLPKIGVRQYRGVLRHARPSARTNARDTVNVLRLDEYVKGVVPAEMPASWHPEAVQAQAVAARTYALQQRADHLRRYYQICDTTACQVYRGISGEHPLASAAVDATAGVYLTYRGRPAFTQFSASSGGWTSAGNVPYLTSKADPYDAWSGNKVHDWTVGINRSALQKRYPSLGTVTGLRITQREGGGDWGGRVLTAEVRGTKGTVKVSGNTLRSVFGLRSTWFTKA